MRRRTLLEGVAMGAAALPLAGWGAPVPAAARRRAEDADPWRGLRAGVASYSLRRLSLEDGYPHLLSFEYEKDPEDPLPGLAESVGYARGVLAAMP